MKNSEIFKENKYVLVKNALSKEVCHIASQYTLFDEKQNYLPYDMQVPQSHSKYSDPLMESLLEYLQSTVEESTGLELFPTYSYYRVYRNGNYLAPHTDRNACEISATLSLGYNYTENYEETWPINVEGNDFFLDAGDMVIYRGIELVHSRSIFFAPENSFHSQVFLHYVDKNGPHASLKYDGRDNLGIKK